MKLTLIRALAATAVLGTLASAQIERLTLAQMVEKADAGVRGTIVAKEVHKVRHPGGVGALYYTTLHVEGTTLGDREETTVSVSYAGGFVDDEDGVWNSEAPTDAETKVGSDVVVFYKWSDDMGGGFASNALYAAHGGLYTTFVNRRGKTIVQGRGDGYAVRKNVTCDGLCSDVRRIRAEQARRRQGK